MEDIPHWLYELLPTIYVMAGAVAGALIPHAALPALLVIVGIKVFHMRLSNRSS